MKEEEGTDEKSKRANGREEIVNGEKEAMFTVCLHWTTTQMKPRQTTFI